jgi:hypothetical protein
MSHNIPAEIRLFFEQDNCKLIPSTDDFSFAKLSWDIIDGNLLIEKDVAATWDDQYEVPSSYHWNGKIYSEAEMLRLIKLKAFL